MVENDEVELNWPVMANPPATISWYWNGEPLDLSLGEFVRFVFLSTKFIERRYVNVEALNQWNNTNVSKLENVHTLQKLGNANYAV